MTLSAPRRIWWLVQQGLREVVQMRFSWIAGLTTVVMIAGASVLREFNFGAEESRFLRDYAEATLALWGTVVALMLNISLVQSGVSRGTLVMTFMRGVRRHEWLLSRWVAVGVALGWLTLLGYGTLGVLLTQYGHAVSWGELALWGGRMFLRLALISSFALAACAVSQGLLLASGLALGLTMAAQLSSILEWAGRHSGSAVRWCWQGLEWLVPAFRMLEAGTSMGAAIIYALGYSALYALLACALFSRREI